MRFATPLLLALLLGTTALAGPGDKIKEITVEMDLDAVTNPAAAARFGTLATDLQGAIAARLADRIGEEGMDLNIDLSEAELSNSFTDAAGLADTVLVGTVHLSDKDDNSSIRHYELTVNIEQARTFFPAELDQATLTASSEEYYTALITAFADGVVKRIDE